LDEKHYAALYRERKDCYHGQRPVPQEKKLQEICGKAGAGLLFLPPYSPDFNPIEKEWADMKRGLRDTAPLHALFETAIYKYWS
jgi:transposase